MSGSNPADGVPAERADADVEAALAAHMSVQGICRCGVNLRGMGWGRRWTDHLAAALAPLIAAAEQRGYDRARQDGAP